MRVLTYNVHHWVGVDKRRDIERIAKVIETTRADIVALQEAHDATGRGDRNAAPLTWLARRLGMAAVHGITLPDCAISDLQGPFGNALLSRYPLLAHANHHLPTDEGHEARALLETRLLLPAGTALTVYVTHLDQHSETLRFAQANALLLWTGRDRTRPHLLLGDFNAQTPEEAANAAERRQAIAPQTAELPTAHKVIPRLLKAHYVDCFAQAGKGEGKTYPTRGPARRIDYIFASQPMAAALQGCWRWEEERAMMASDHYPVLAEFDFSKL